MRLIGFGCSWTYGSELYNPDIGEEYHKEHILFRESNCWLGRLANRLGCEFDNRAEPANSNFAISQQVAQYFLNCYNNEKIIICIGWTANTRMSWFDDKWVHNGFASNEYGWTRSAREWVLRSTNESHNMYTNNAKLFVNSICDSMNIPIIQFNAIGHHDTTNYKNYFIDGATMDSMLRNAMQEDDRKKFFCPGDHPNEEGHEYFTSRLTDFVKSHIIIE